VIGPGSGNPAPSFAGTVLVGTAGSLLSCSGAPCSRDMESGVVLKVSRSLGGRATRLSRGAGWQKFPGRGHMSGADA
jgi:hypothetical protein